MGGTFDFERSRLLGWVTIEPAHIVADQGGTSSAIRVIDACQTCYVARVLGAAHGER
jgi:hypothetical protein